MCRSLSVFVEYGAPTADVQLWKLAESRLQYKLNLSICLVWVSIIRLMWCRAICMCVIALNCCSSFRSRSASLFNTTACRRVARLIYMGNLIMILSRCDCAIFIAVSCRNGILRVSVLSGVGGVGMGLNRSTKNLCPYLRHTNRRTWNVSSTSKRLASGAPYRAWTQLVFFSRRRHYQHICAFCANTARARTNRSNAFRFFRHIHIQC